MTVGEDNSDVQYVVSYVATIILFIIILTYAQIIAQEIASEKGTRIMEVILSDYNGSKTFLWQIDRRFACCCDRNGIIWRDFWRRI